MSRTQVLFVLDKLTVGDAHLHGVTRLCAWWIPAYDGSRYDVQAVCLRGRDPAGEYLESLGIRMHYLNRSSFDPRVIPKLLSLMRRESTQLLHLHGYGSTNFGRICAWLARVPCIVHEHIVDEHMPGVQRIADRLLARLTTQAIAISKAVKAFMAKDRAIPAHKIEVIYNGIPLDAYEDPVTVLDGLFESTPRGGPTAPDEESWREAAGVPAHHRLVTIVGRLHPLKGHRYFLEAAKAVRQHVADVSFIVVGDGELQAKLEKQAENLGIRPWVHFLGHRDDVPEILRDSDISVVASLSEGGPLVLFEAMAARCATIVTRSCGLSELIVEGKNGFLVAPRDASGIAAKTLALLDDPALCKRVAEEGRRDSFGYDVDSTVRRFEKMYDAMLLNALRLKG